MAADQQEPWIVDIDTHTVSGGISNTIELAASMKDPPTEEDYSNARLIAAAPTLLAALRDLIGCFSTDMLENRALFEAACDAIIEAEGEDISRTGGPSPKGGRGSTEIHV